VGGNQLRRHLAFTGSCGTRLPGGALRCRTHVSSLGRAVAFLPAHTAAAETHGKPNPDRLNVNGLWKTRERAASPTGSGAGESAARSAGCVRHMKGARVVRQPLGPATRSVAYC
jgi:hypothetical protein